MSAALRIGLAGLGTVGAGLLSLLREAPPNSPLSRIAVAAVSARSRTRKRGVDISALPFEDDPGALAQREDVDVFVELIGGSDGPAKHAVELALKRGRPVVTANKALMAEHGAEIAALSEAHAAPVYFEAAIGGGMPIVKALRESLAGARPSRIAGILNGTCNYLLTEMEAAGRGFADVLGEAQRLGYAEADPTMDVGGFDAAHKIALLAAIGFSATPDYPAVSVEGVEGVELIDLRLAAKLGFRIKLIASAEREADGAVRTQVAPTLLPFAHPLARVDGALNAVLVDAEPVGRLTFTGRGAGAGPTAAAVAADLIDVLHGARRPAFGRPLAALGASAQAGPPPPRSYYVRLMVEERPGVVAGVSNALAAAGVSIHAFLQDPVADEALVPIVLTTRACPRAALDQAVDEIARLPAVAGPPRVMAIETEGDGARPWSATR